MIKNENIICFSNDWDADPLSKHHIMKRFAQHNRVLWINSIGLRQPKINAQDAQKVVTKLKAFVRKVKRVENDLWVYSPLVIPFHANPIVQRLNRKILTLQIRACQSRLGMRKPIFWTFMPNAVHCRGAFDEKFCLYYITDDFGEFEGYPTRAIRTMEKKLIASSDLVIASAKRLEEKNARYGKPIEVISHGVDLSHFSQILTSNNLEIPKDIASIRKPILGFFGEINHWIDIPLLTEAAEQKPEWSFVIIGRVAAEAGDISSFSQLPNVHFLGQKPFDILPAYCKKFDIGIVIKKINELTLSMNSLKLKEYLAAGLPVITTPLPEALPYSDVVKTAKTTDEFISAVQDILDGNVPNSQELSDRVKDETWDAKCEIISALIEQKLNN